MSDPFESDREDNAVNEQNYSGDEPQTDGLGKDLLEAALEVAYARQTADASLVNWLTFCSYRANRGYGISAEQLAKLFGAEEGARMEVAYQKERG